MAKKCRVPQLCRKCRKTHHTLLHIDSNEPRDEAASETFSNVTHVPQLRQSKQVLLMTCRAKIFGPDSNYTQERVFLDPGGACSFILERPVQQLRLPHRKNITTILGIAGIKATHTRGAVNFTLGHARDGKRRIRVENVYVLSKVTADMSVSSVGSISEWKHLAGLDLADSDYGTQAQVDVLLGADYYGEEVLHGRQWGLRGTPHAQETCFGWVLAGPLPAKNPGPSVYTCCVALENDSLKRFWEIENYNLKRPVLSLEERAMVEHFDAHHHKDESSRFVVPLPQKPDVVVLRESRSQGLERFFKLERSWQKRGTFRNSRTSFVNI